jgi:hypothetical protein
MCFCGSQHMLTILINTNTKVGIFAQQTMVSATTSAATFSSACPICGSALG